jgi:purine operon repressor
LPGGYVYINDILSNPIITDKLGRMLASQFYNANPDFVLTVETKGITLAMATARALGINSVICKREQQSGLDLPYVSINYISGSSGRLQTMSLAKKLVKRRAAGFNYRRLYEGGRHSAGMMEMMRELFNYRCWHRNDDHAGSGHKKNCGRRKISYDLKRYR